MAEETAGEAAERAPAEREAAAPPAPPGVPTVVVDGLHVVYRIHAASTGRGSATAALRRMLLRKGPRGVHEVHG